MTRKGSTKIKDLTDIPYPAVMDEIQRLQFKLDLTVERLENFLKPYEGAIATLDYLAWLRERHNLGTMGSSGNVIGVEVTQSVQFFSPSVNIVLPKDALGRKGSQPDNDLPLVAGKATVFRAYIQNVRAVSGSIQWRPVGETNWSTPLPALNSPLDPPNIHIGERSMANSSLNFRLPAWVCHGNLEVLLNFSGILRLSSLPHSFSFNCTPTFQAVSPLRIRLLRMRFEGRGVTPIPAPTMTDFWYTTTTLRRMFPLSDICLWAESEQLYDGDFSNMFPGGEHEPGTGNGGTTGDWLHILTHTILLENAPTAIQYVMLYPWGATGWNNFPGFAINRMALAPAGFPFTLPHELGHLCGRPHAPSPCGGPPPDPSYPQYGNFGTASIGEFGLDVETLSIKNPETHKDFMSYCDPKWISPYQYEHIRNWLLNNPGPTTCIQGAPISPESSNLLPRNENQREQLALTLQIYRNGRVRLSRPCLHLPMSFGAEQNGVKTEYFVELRNDEGNPISAIRLWLQDANLTLDAALTSYFTLLPWNDTATEVVVLRGNDVLESFPIEPKAPQILEPRWEETKDETVRRLSWTNDNPVVRFAVRYSPNGGDTWRTVETWLEKPSCFIDNKTLPCGENGIIEIIASAGFRTSRFSVKLGTVTRMARVATIISPVPKLVTRVGDTVVFLGYSMSKDGEAPVGSLQWSSSQDGILGVGRELLIHTLSPGRHIITLSTDDGIGGVALAKSTITVRK